MPLHRPPIPAPRVVRGVVTATTALALVTPLLVAQATSAQAVDTTSPVVVSEVYGGGGNSGAPYKNDFVELYNRGTTTVDLSTWSVQYASATGTSWQVTKLVGTIPAGGYYLVAEGAGSGNGVALPTADATGTIAMSSTAGKIALAQTQSPLSCATACNSAAGVVDLVGYGSTANDYPGSGPAATLSNTTSAQRTPTAGTNTGDNAKDFSAAAPTPKAAPGSTGGGGTDCSVTPLPTECTPGPDRIQDVQGDGFVSPKKGQTVTRVPGVVTAVNSPKGFWIQDPNPDTARTTASSGIYVFTSAAAPAVGSAVLVSGTVSDYYPLASGETVDTTANLSTTELTNVSVTTVSTGNAVPAALAVGPDTVPDLYAPTTASGNVESISPVDPTHSALEFWEAHEGMLVSVSDAPVVGPGKPQYGEIYVTTKPDQKRTPRGGTYLPSYDGTPSGRLLVAPLPGITTPAANVGDVLTGTTSGPVDWSSYGGYSLRANRLGTYQDNHLAPAVAGDAAADQMTVATYNVENLAPSDPQTKFDRLAAGVVTNLRSPDVIAVEEVQDNSGATDDGTTASDRTVAKLTAAISAAGGPAYSSTSIDPANDQDGGQPGGNIRIVFLYNPSRVGFTPKGTPTATTPVTVSKDADGTATLSTNPGRIDPTNTAFDSSRKPLAAEFTFQGKKVIVVGNHWNSKGGDQSADGRFQPPTRSSETQRTAQATAVNGFVKDVLGVDGGANLVLAGDFNDYQFSQAVTTLTDDGATLTDLIDTLPVDQRYTYVFNGISQVLDHIFVSKALKDVEYDVVHVNAEYSDQASDHDPQVARIRPAAYVAPTATVNLLNINDFHGRIDSNTVKFAGTIEKLRAAAGEDKTLFLSAGDNIGATLFASASQDDQPTIDVLDALGLTASAVGNHEFDKGYADLVDRVVANGTNARWPYLGANVYQKGTTTPALPEYATFQVDGLTVGVIGTVTQETPSLVSPGGISGLDFGDPVAATNRVADQLTDGDPSNGEADVLVAEYHEGASEGTPDGATLQQEVAAGGAFADIVTKTSPKVAAIFTGHTHKMYAWDAPVPGDTTGRTRPVLQTGSYGENIGRVTLTVDRATHAVTSYTQANVARTTDADSALVAAYPRVAEVDRITKAAIAKATEVGQRTVGHVAADITTAYVGTSRDDRSKESTLGDTVANALRDQLTDSRLGGAQIGVVNPGGLRSELLYKSSGTAGDADGVVTYAEANAVLPFANNLWTLSLTGDQFRQVLEQQWQPSGASRPFLALGLSDNVSYTYDPTKAAGSRITSVTVDGKPLDPAASYRIGTFSFLATGGDNFTAFKGGTAVQDTGLLDRDAWVAYLGAHDPLSPSFARRGVVVTNQPSAVTAGDSVSFGLGIAPPASPAVLPGQSTLDLTSLGSPANTSVTATLDGTGGPTVGSASVSNGIASLTVSIPLDTSGGAHTLTVVAQPSGTTVSIPLTVTARPLGTLSVVPKQARVGQYVQVKLTGSVPLARVTVQLDGTGPAAQLRTKLNGSGQTSLYLPAGTTKGTHQVVATLPDGRTVTTTLKVLLPLS